VARKEKAAYTLYVLYSHSTFRFAGISFNPCHFCSPHFPTLHPLHGVSGLGFSLLRAIGEDLSIIVDEHRLGDGYAVFYVILHTVD